MLTLDQIDIGDVIEHPAARIARKVVRVYAGRVETTDGVNHFSVDEARLIGCGWRMKKKGGFQCYR